MVSNWWRRVASSDVAGAGGVVFLPVGAFEQHGPYLPLATDVLIAEGLAEALRQRVPGVVLPAVPVSCSQEHAGWPGTVSVPSHVVSSYVAAVLGGLRSSGFSRVVVVSGHGGNYWLSNVVQEANVDDPSVVLFPTRQARAAAFTAAELVNAPDVDVHAGEYETSLGLHLGFADARATQAGDTVVGGVALLSLVGFKGYTSTGVVGAPSLASAAKGQLLVEAYQESFVQLWGQWVDGELPHPS